MAFVKSESDPPCFVRIYSDQAEIIQPLDKLPLEFTHDDWNEIRSDSITLIGQNVNITSQTITEKLKSLNGAEIYVRSPMSFDKTTLIFVKGTLIDEIENIVKVEDTSIAGQQPLFFTVSSDQIFYLEQPSKSKFYVNFTYNTTDSKIDVSYLRSSLKWHTQYQLNLYNDESILIAMANIRNDGKSSISINQAELIGGDINLHRQENYALQTMRASMSKKSFEAAGELSAPTIEEGNEFSGLYVFAINKPFLINAKTNYILPMFRPNITIERYGLISNYFSTTSYSGKVQRSYRLISDRFLSHGNCIIREFDRIVGEISIPNIGAKDKYDFSIGEDADIVYKENITLFSSIQFNEEIIKENSSSKKIRSSIDQIRTRYIYEINVQIKNFKIRSVSIEYEQKGFYGFLSVKLLNSNNHQFIQDGSIIKTNMILNANEDQTYSYSIELIS